MNPRGLRASGRTGSEAMASRLAVAEAALKEGRASMVVSFEEEATDEAEIIEPRPHRRGFGAGRFRPSAPEPNPPGSDGGGRGDAKNRSWGRVDSGRTVTKR